ncbi:bifunctional riboflavin kinase/FAD synthetase [uncultured Sharpea sp.]|uniref:bifunctional riboflavin kinase/FAD synthetase n=1 Tax=uncultured Sharpea sp. TaxID=1112738 RepID=UPI00258DC935|nr:bifunctional riboflavin kinase/FAD synthetase [uncultured Sharpea sp.]
MEVIDLKLHDLPHLTDNYVVAIGFFDGLHLGHQKLIEEVKRVSVKKNYKSAVMTFDQHPLVVLKGEERRYLTSSLDRDRILKKLGIETLFVIHFSSEVASLSPEDFIAQYIIGLHIKHVVVGFDFHFGNKNSGDVHSLEGHDFELSVVPPVMYDEKVKVSSTLIKSLLHSGHIRDANKLLTRDYAITGEVIHGKARGRLIGFPTANVAIGKYCYLAKGVYGVEVEVKGKRYKGMANIGMNPTFNDIFEMSLEIYIFDFHEDIYGEIMRVFFKFFERPEERFNDVDDLIKEMQYDEAYIRKALDI